MRFKAGVVITTLAALTIAATMTVPFIDNLNGGVATIKWPGQPTRGGSGTLILHQAETQRDITVDINYQGYGPGAGYGIYVSELPPTSGLYGITECVVDGQQCDVHGNDLIYVEISKVFAPLVRK